MGEEVRFNTQNQKFERSSPLYARILNFTNVCYTFLSKTLMSQTHLSSFLP